MGITIKNDRAEELARQLAAETGESLMEAIIHSLEERLEHLKGRRSVPGLFETLMEVSQRSSSLPDLDPREAEEILGYDEKGAFRELRREERLQKPIRAVAVRNAAGRIEEEP
jgi:antitoxin VapB